MENLNLAALSHPIREAKVVRFRRILHFAVLREAETLFCAA